MLKKTMPVHSTGIVDGAIREELRWLTGQPNPASLASAAADLRARAPKGWPRRLGLLRVLRRQIDRDRPARQEDRESVLGEPPAILVAVRRSNRRCRRLFLLRR